MTSCLNSKRNTGDNGNSGDDDDLRQPDNTAFYTKLQGLLKKRLGLIQSQMWLQFGNEAYAEWSNAARIQFAMIQTVFAAIMTQLLSHARNISDLHHFADGFINEEETRSSSLENASAIVGDCNDEATHNDTSLLPKICFMNESQFPYWTRRSSGTIPL